MAGYTTVTGTVLDPTGRVYQNGAFNFSFVNGPTGKQPTLANGQSFELSISGSLDSFGFFSIPLADNGIIAATSGATGTSWYFSICANGNILGLPAGAPVPCFNYTSPIVCATNTPNTCSGTTIDISAQLKAVAALLPNPTGVFTGAPTLFAGVPTGPCAASQTAVNTLTGDLYDCVSTAWFKVGPGGVPLNAALKPTLPGDPVQYVSSNGNDANDGLFWGSAKLTFYAAVKALPGGTASQAGSGTMYVGPGVAVGAPDGGGVRFVGPGSTEFASPSTGWLRAPGALHVKCAEANVGGQFSSGPQCQESWGSGALIPAVWINGTSGGITFDGFRFSTQGTSIRIGVDSTLNRNNGGASNLHFRNISGTDASGTLGHGPQVDIGSNVFWVYFDDISMTGSIEEWSVNLSRVSGVVTATVQSGVPGTSAIHDLVTGNHISIYPNNPTGDTSFTGTFTLTGVADSTHFTYSQSAPDSTITAAIAIGDKGFGMTVDPGVGAGSGLIEVNRWSGTGIKFYGGNSGGSISVRDLTVEAPFSVNPPGIWISGGLAGAFISHVELADVTGNTACVVVDPIVNPNNVFVEFVSGGGSGAIDGSVYFGGFMNKQPVSSATHGMSSTAPTPTRAGAFGIVNGHVYAQHDGHRRSFSPSAVRFANLAQTSSANWFFNDTGGPTHTLTTGIVAPDGTTGASQVSIGSGGQSAFSYHALQNLPVTVAIGQWFIGGVWVQSQTANGYQNNGVGLSFQLAGANNFLSQGIGYTGAGLNSSSWEWVWFAYKVLGAGTPAATVAMFSRADFTHTIQVYAPVLVQIPAGSLSDNEASDLAMHLASYPTAAAVGEVAMLPGERFRPGTTTFANLGAAPSGVTFIGCSDCTIANPCAGGGTGALAKSLNSIWVCN
jgi:hypothetical protein